VATRADAPDRGRPDWRTGLLAASAVLLGAACEAPPAPPPDEPPAAVEVAPATYCAAGGSASLRWADAGALPDLHYDDPANGSRLAAWVQQGVFEGLYGVASDLTFVPELLAEAGEVVANADGTFTYQFVLREGVQWSDGTPITAETVRDTWAVFVDPAFMHSRKLDYRRILADSWELDGQAFSYRTETFFAGHPMLFSRLLPTHTLPDAEAANEALRTLTIDGTPLPASGPFAFASWEPDEPLRLERNEAYHGAHPANPDRVNPDTACVDGVEIVPGLDATALAHALRAGEVDLITAPAAPELGELSATSRVAIVTATSGAFEHWGFNLHNPHLSQVHVREAVALAIDRRRIVEDLYEGIYGNGLPPAGTGAVYWVAGSAPYVDHQGDAGYGRGNATAAARVLEDAGYTRNADGVYEHPERGVLELRVSTTGGDELRERQQQLLQEQLAEAGIRITIDNRPATAHFTEQAFHPAHIACSVTQGDHGSQVTLGDGHIVVADCGIVDVVQFAWENHPWPAGRSVAGLTQPDIDAHASFAREAEANPYGYANPDFDALARRCDATVDDEERGGCYHALDRYLTTRTIDPDGLVVVPLTTRPVFAAYDTTSLQRPAAIVDVPQAGPLVHGVVRPLVRRLTPQGIARRVELHLPGMHNRLLSCVDLAHGETPKLLSPAFLQRLLSEAVERLRPFRPSAVIDRSSLQRAGSFACVGMVGLLLSYAIFPDRLPTAVARIFSPFADIPPASGVSYEVAPGDHRILRGDDLVFSAVVTKGQPEMLQLRHDGASPAPVRVRCLRSVTAGDSQSCVLAGSGVLRARDFGHMRVRDADEMVVIDPS
jgi:peptide/nickel transport system substrate-binding protein